ncbi:MAG: DUF222 domain-containing protein, partial [Acidimicrobiales bacterium]
TGLEPSSSRQTIAVIREMEAVSGQLELAQAEIVDHIDRSGLHRHDRHFSAKVMVRHHGRLTAGEALARTRVAAMLRDLPEVAVAADRGEVPAAYLRRIAVIHANPRVRPHLLESQSWFLTQAAQRTSYRDFDMVSAEWTRLADEDGARQRNDINHANRDFRIRQHLDLSFAHAGSCAAYAGARQKEVLQAFADAELEIDWEKARAEHGDDATREHLARTPAQRRADAFDRMCTQAASHLPGAEAPGTITNIVIDHETYGRELSRLAGGTVLPADPTRSTYRCATLAGDLLEPTEAVAAGLLGHVRRIVLGADSVVIDQGRKQRLFTGNARLAAMIPHDHCYWPGCTVPATQCEIDHLEPWFPHGRTDQANSGPACGHHNRGKEHGFTVTRNPGGTYRILRPDRTQLE